MATRYTTVEEVRAEALLLDPDTVTDDDIERWIDQATRRIHAAIAKIYAFPITVVEDAPTAVLKDIATNYAVGKALRKHFSDRHLPSDEKGPWEPYFEEADALLEALVEGDQLDGVVDRPTAWPTTVISNGMDDGVVPHMDVVELEIERAQGRLMTEAELDLLTRTAL